eukprot:1159555-Pelagomonas_calceolata.AAC.8
MVTVHIPLFQLSNQGSALVTVHIPLFLPSNREGQTAGASYSYPNSYSATGMAKPLVPLTAAGLFMGTHLLLSFAFTCSREGHIIDASMGVPDLHF